MYKTKTYHIVCDVEIPTFVEIDEKQTLEQALKSLVSGGVEIHNVKIVDTKKELFEDEFKEYVLKECKRQWKDCQEEEYGPWKEQSLETKIEYFRDMFEFLKTKEEIQRNK